MVTHYFMRHVQIWPKSRGLGCVTSAPAADENRDAGFTRFRVDAHNIKAICVVLSSYSLEATHRLHRRTATYHYSDSWQHF